MPSNSKGGNKGGGRDKGDSNSKRGSGAMEDERQKETTSKGGKTTHEKSMDQERMSKESREEGKKGGPR
jgi:hypothetical protein